MCQLSRVTCHMLHVTCHLSLTQTATVTHPLPVNSPTMHSRLVCKDAKTLKNVKTQEVIEAAKQQKCLEVCQYLRYAP